ncbi:hypothetical protein GGI35DRAFT_453274 [Trichoderma velutinum]
MIHIGNGTWIHDYEACKGESSSFLAKAIPYGGTNSTESKRDNNCSGTAQGNSGSACHNTPIGNSASFSYGQSTAACEIPLHLPGGVSPTFHSVSITFGLRCYGNTLQVNGYSDNACSNYESSYTTHPTTANGDSLCAAQLNYVSWLIFVAS